jgi:hypothetical protein
MTAGQLVPEGHGVWWLVLHYKPAVVRPLKTPTGILSEVKPVIKWMHSMSRNCSTMDRDKKEKARKGL